MARKGGIPAELKSSIVAEYALGHSTEWLGRKYQMSARTVAAIVRAAGANVRPTGRARVHSVNDSAFDTISEESAYWAGFLMADGCLTSRGHQIILGLAECDRSHVEKFRDYLGSTHRVTLSLPGSWSIPGATTQCRVCITSERAWTSLTTLGITPRKSLTAEAAPELARHSAFWRGVIDGDGCIVITGRGTTVLSLTGAQRLLEQFREFVLKLVPGCKATVRPIKRSRAFVFAVSSQIAKTVIRELYDGARVSLDRKFALAAQVAGCGFGRPIETQR